MKGSQEVLKTVSHFWSGHNNISVGKFTVLVLHRVFGKQATHTPTQFYWEYPPPPPTKSEEKEKTGKYVIIMLV